MELNNNLTERYRPKTLDDFRGNDSMVNALEAVLDLPKEKLPHAFLLSGPTGCVDQDTEFLTPKGWKKISEWNYDEVMQYNVDGTSEFVKPLSYIKRRSKTLYSIKTKYGIDQCLSKDHRFVYFLPNKNSKIYESSFGEIITKHNSTKFGFSGKIKTVFSPKIQTVFPLTEDELRVQVMFNADGTIVENRNKHCVNLKKQRKIDRAIYLLKQANIPFDTYKMGNGYIRFYFVPPMLNKHYTDDYYLCNPNQLGVIADEVLFWDGDCKSQFTSTSKQDADFIQYVFTATNKRASICNDVREGRNPVYRVCITDRVFIGIESSKNKVQILEYSTIDGFEYCFTVPSSYLILRRNGNIFITGNCGKTTLARIIANELGCSGSDYTEIDAGLTGGVDVIRDLRSNMMYKPLESACRVWVIDEAHKLTKPFQDGMLKTLEDPMSHNFFILCTTNPNGLIPTVRGRCSNFPVKLLTTKEMTVFLKKVCKAENDILDETLIQDIVEQAEGHPRNALMILEQVLAMPSKLRAEIAQFSMETKTEAFALAQALFAPKLNWKSLSSLIKGLNTSEAETVRRIVMAYADKVLLDGSENMFKRAGLVIGHFRKPTYDNGLQDISYYCYLIYLTS